MLGGFPGTVAGSQLIASYTELHSQSPISRKMATNKPSTPAHTDMIDTQAVQLLSVMSFGFSPYLDARNKSDAVTAIGPSAKTRANTMQHKLLITVL